MPALDKCPHMVARCPHKRPDCDDPASEQCHYITLATGAAVSLTSAFAAIAPGQLPSGLRKRLEMAQLLLHGPE